MFFNIFIFLITGLEELQSRSQPVQRDLPRPMEINMSVLRGAQNDTPLTDLQKVIRIKLKFYLYLRNFLLSNESTNILIHSLAPSLLFNEHFIFI